MNLFEKALLMHDFLIMSHRGVWGGNVIQNTRQAAQLAKRAGADIVEVDISRSSDGTYYLFHDESSPYLLQSKLTLGELTSGEVDDLEYYNSRSTLSGYGIEKLSDFLDWLPINMLINIDLAWNYFDDPLLYQIIESSGKKDQIYFKSYPKDDRLKYFEELSGGMNYVPLIFEQEDVRKCRETYPGLNIIGYEIIIKDDQSDLLEPGFLAQFHAEQKLLIANSEYVAKDFKIYNGWNDDQALFDQEEDSWGKMLDTGVNTIMTDWPYFLNDYRKSRGLM